MPRRAIVQARCFCYTSNIMEETLLHKLPDISEKKLSPELIALDLDDTLLKNDLTISDYTVQTLQRAADRGIYIVLCSGRTDNAILPYVRRLDIAGKPAGRYIVAQNGTSITDLHERREIYAKLTDGDILVEGYHEAQAMGLAVEVCDASTIYTPCVNSYVERDAALTNLRLEIISDFESFLQKKFPKLIVSGDPAVIERLEQRMRSVMGSRCVMARSKPFYLEIQSPGTGKGEALIWLADYLHLDRKRIMAFGDSMNDETMMRNAELSVAMKNGLAVIQEQARYVSAYTNDEDGVARFIDAYVL